jgi:hypothetical protein
MAVIQTLTVEELDVVNHILQGESIKEFSRSDLIKRLDTVITINLDEAITALYEELKSKVNDITDDDWNEMREYFPVSLPYSEDDDD